MQTKQPELGQKIQELRKAQGLTQEELVERCNINVRTIQRIEAGEVTPRSHTIRVILEALNYDYSKVSDLASNSPKGASVQWIFYGFISGIIYLLLAFLESYLDLFLLAEGQKDVSPVLYVGVKLAVVLFFIGYMGGFYVLSKLWANTWLQVGTVLLTVATLVIIGADLFLFFNDTLSEVGILVSQSILTGAIYLVFGVGVIQYQKVFGNLALVMGIVAIITGLAFLSVILALPGLIVLTVLEVLGLVLLYRGYDRAGAIECE